MDNESLVIDTNFIGSSQNSRTYAGTVRSKKCSVLATSKISDTCQYCAGLHGMVSSDKILIESLDTEISKLEFIYELDLEFTFPMISLCQVVVRVI